MRTAQSWRVPTTLTAGSTAIAEDFSQVEQAAAGTVKKILLGGGDKTFCWRSLTSASPSRTSTAGTTMSKISSLAGPSRLRFMEHVQEHCHTQACQQMNSACQQRYQRNPTTCKARHITDEACCQQNGQKNHPDQCEECRALEAHARSILLRRGQSSGFPRSGSLR